MGILSKKEQFIASVILLACAGIAIFILFFSNISKRFPEKNVQPLAREQFGDADADYDGLTDREEADLGTNPQNPDTDNDDYMDGEEIAQNTSPLDKTSFSSVASLNSLIAQQDAPYTDQFIGTLLNDIALNDRLFVTESTSTDAVQLHVGYKPEDIERVASTLTDTFLQNKDIVNIRRMEDGELAVIQDNGSEAVDAYIRGLFAIIAEKESVNDLQSFFSKIEEGGTDEDGGLNAELKALARTRIIPALSLMDKKLRALQVPSDWKEMHKDEIAIVAGQKLAVSYLADSASADPLRVLYGLAMLNKTGEDWDAWKEKAIEMLKG